MSSVKTNKMANSGIPDMDTTGYMDTSWKKRRMNVQNVSHMFLLALSLCSLVCCLLFVAVCEHLFNLLLGYLLLMMMLWRPCC